MQENERVKYSENEKEFLETKNTAEIRNTIGELGINVNRK